MRWIYTNVNDLTIQTPNTCTFTGRHLNLNQDAIMAQEDANGITNCVDPDQSPVGVV